MVQVNQIIVVRGTVQAEGESISILANSVQTKLTIAKDAAAARRGPAMPTEPDWGNGYDFWPPPDDWNDTPAAPTRRAAEPAPGYDAPNGEILSTVPPPPDEAEDEEEQAGFGSPPGPADDEPTRPDPAAVDEAQEPPPPPVVEMPERMTNDELRMTNGAEGSLPATEYRPVTNDRRPVVTRPSAASDQSAPYDDAPLPGNGSYKLLIVEVRASGNWKDTCRQTLRLAERYEGNAMLRLQLAGQDLTMDFPNHLIGCEAELIEALERLPGVGRVIER
jgi:hypothetical protein